MHITAPLFLMDVVYQTDEPERWSSMYAQALAAYKRNDAVIAKRPLTILRSPRIDSEKMAWDHLPLGHLQLDLDEKDYKPSSVWCLLLVDGLGIVLSAVDAGKRVFLRTGLFHTMTGIWGESLNDSMPETVCIL